MSNSSEQVRLDPSDNKKQLYYNVSISSLSDPLLIYFTAKSYNLNPVLDRDNKTLLKLDNSHDILYNDDGKLLLDKYNILQYEFNPLKNRKLLSKIIEFENIQFKSLQDGNIGAYIIEENPTPTHDDNYLIYAAQKSPCKKKAVLKTVIRKYIGQSILVIE